MRVDEPKLQIMKIFLSIAMLLSFRSAQPGTNFETLYKLAGGTWVMQTKKGTPCERWTKQNAHKLTNRSWKTTGTDTTWLENVELERKGNSISYNSLVSDQNGGQRIPFTLVEAKNGRFTFSNPAHDFPQTIVYEFIGKDSLHAWIDGKPNGKEKRLDFYYARVK